MLTLYYTKVKTYTTVIVLVCGSGIPVTLGCDAFAIIMGKGLSQYTVHTACYITS